MPEFNRAYKVDTTVTAQFQLWGDCDLPEAECVFSVQHGIEDDLASDLTVRLLTVRIGGFLATNDQIAKMIGEAHLVMRENDFAELYAQNFTMEDIQ